MSRDTAALTSHLRERLGPNLRLVFDYQGEDVSFSYVRDDLPRDLVRERCELMVDLYQNEYRELVERGDDEVDLTSLTASLHLFDIGLILNLRDPTNPEGGVAFTFDYETGSRLIGFVAECSEVLYGDVYHTVPDDPLSDLVE
ncbi:hypothetical protein U3A55_11330 [Salarchaeum sp. III]|uniref:hypothetical protein n=1 Tax=Salarchaeum sp. III TaxID=3107927 RepID=UPI002EDAA64E